MNAFRPDTLSLVVFASHVAVSVMLVSAAGVLILRFCRTRDPQVRHAVAVSTLVGMLVIPFLSYFYQTRLMRPAALPWPVAKHRHADQGDATVGGMPRQDELYEYGPSGPPPDSSTTVMQRLLTAFAIVWPLGTMLSAIAGIISVYRQRQFLIHLPRVTDPPLLKAVGRLQRKLGIRRTVTLLQSRHTPWPFTVGVMRPQIVVPVDLTRTVDSRRLRSALAHELAHIARFDYAMAWFEGVVRATFWWNPFVYTVVNELSVAREQICDTFVLDCDGHGKSLADYLIVSLEQAANANFFWGVGMSANDPHNVELRIKRLLSGNKNMLRLPRYAKFCVLCLTVLLCTLCVRIDYARAEFILGTPQNFGSVLNSDANENHPVLSPDGLTLYFHSNRAGGLGHADIWFSNRTSLDSEWSAPENFRSINSPFDDLTPFVSDTGLSFLYSLGLSGVPGKIYELSRSSVDAEWSEKLLLPSPINDDLSNSHAPFITADGNAILFTSDREGGFGREDLYEATRVSRNDPWEVRNLGPNINSSARDNNAVMSPDGLTLVFASERSGGEGDFDLWISQRDTISEDWGVAANMGSSVNTARGELPSQIWGPGSLLLFKSAGLPGEGGDDMFYVKIVPEPASCAMPLWGMLLVVESVRRRRKRR